MDNLTTCDRCGSDACYVQEVNETVNYTFVTDVVSKLTM
jgi:hypothetical protein